jgi:hypothetical protein
MRIHREKKRTFEDIEESNKFINQEISINRHKFLKQAKDIIYKNFPGVTLEQERFYGKKPNDTITLKAKNDCVGRSCPISVRQHSKNSIYFLLQPGTQMIKVKCFKCEGYVELKNNSSIFEDIKKSIVISDKATKKQKTKDFTLECLDEVTIVKFNHQVVHVDDKLMMDFYDVNSFVYVAAHKHKKSPVFSNWVARTLSDNEYINFKYNNIAIICGEVSGIFVIDVDIQDDGLKYFQQLCSKHNYRYDQRTTCVETPSGGIHLYYEYNEIFSNNSVKLRSTNGDKVGIDIRSNGGCVISPPSKYEKGVYRFLCIKKPQPCPDFLYILTDKCTI